MPGEVVALYCARVKGELPESVPLVMAEAGRGLVGDRYFASPRRRKHEPDTELTLIEVEEIDDFNLRAETTYARPEFRRNVVTRGIRLNDLVGQRFLIGTVEAEGIRLCEPCSRLARFTTKQIVKAMVHRAGLRARIVTSGAISLGDALKVI